MWFWQMHLSKMGASQSSSFLFPAIGIRKDPCFYQIVFVFKLICGLVLSIRHCKIRLCNVCRQLVLLTLFKPKCCMYFSLYARKIMSDTDTQKKHWSTEYCHWQSQGKKLISCQYLKGTSGRGITPKDTCLRVQRCNNLSCGSKTKQKYSTCFVCQRSSFKFVFPLHLDGR